MSPLPLFLPILYLAAHGILVSRSRSSAICSRRLRVLTVDFLLIALFTVLAGRALSLSEEPHGLERVLLLWSPVVFFWWAYLWTRNILDAIHSSGWTIDPLLIRLEAAIGQPSLTWARRGNRLLCEILHIGYNSYFFYTLGLGLFLDLTGRTLEFQAMTAAVTIGYLVSYLTFVLVPADGPRWSLVEQGLLSPDEQRMKGYAVTEFTNRLMFEGPALKGGAMPSSHSSTAVVFLIWCGRLWGPEGALAALAMVLAMWLGSIYGRYHFVLDIIVGGLLGWAAVAAADFLVSA